MNQQSKPQKQYTFKFVKNFDFKTVTINGAYGGLTLKGLININFYTDLPDLPTKITHALNTDGSLGQMMSLEPKAESIREVPFGINVDLETAKNITIWLNAKIKEAEEHTLKVIEARIKNQNNDNSPIHNS